jgi:predicted metal-dependent peptidase
MRTHTVMHAVSHHISINGPHMRSYDRILKQWIQTSVNLQKDDRATYSEIQK